MATRNKTNFLSLETRLRNALRINAGALLGSGRRDAGLTAEVLAEKFARALVMIDEIVAHESGRGNTFTREEAVFLSGDERTYQALADDCWSVEPGTRLYDGSTVPE